MFASFIWHEYCYIKKQEDLGRPIKHARGGVQASSSPTAGLIKTLLCEVASVRFTAVRLISIVKPQYSKGGCLPGSVGSNVWTELQHWLRNLLLSYSELPFSPGLVQARLRRQYICWATKYPSRWLILA